jgi:hypothetical protein
MKCPICQTNIQNPASVKCSQCNSDLEVFKTLGQLKTEIIGTTNIENPEHLSTKQSELAPEAALTKRSSTIIWSSPIFIWVIFAVILISVIGFVYKMQSIMINQLNEERLSRTQAELRSIQATEKFVEKTSESFSNSMQIIVNANKEQQNHIESLNEKIMVLEEKTKELELQKLSKQKSKIKKNSNLRN